MATKAAAKKTATKRNRNQWKHQYRRSCIKRFFVDEIKDIYWAEKKLVSTLPKIAKAAGAPELKDAINDHLEATREHVSRLEQVFELLGEKPVAKKCDAMEGILKRRFRCD
jgi:ferritin-like metal-binding protein YciE